MPLQFLEIGFYVEIHAIECHDFEHETQFHGVVVAWIEFSPCLYYELKCLGWVGVWWWWFGVEWLILISLMRMDWSGYSLVLSQLQCDLLTCRHPFCGSTWKLTRWSRSRKGETEWNCCEGSAGPANSRYEMWRNSEYWHRLSLSKAACLLTNWPF